MNDSNKDLKILIVDNVESARKAVMRHLSKLGYSNFTEAENGQEAISMLEAMPFDLIISDFEMPSMDGIKLMREIRQREELKDIPFVLIATTATKQEVFKAFKSGISSYILKPFSAKILQETIERLVNKSETKPISAKL
ncbi:MAG: response regulator [SAR324 cluster bacterium]|uniref:Response regulator n=1 Tax=SAR324 cluster bacterium TaxID=2024889 RepID=A0A7X9FUA0_9DELT|nr:response regulator [SAR324 cluster bacterium]